MIERSMVVEANKVAIQSVAEDRLDLPKIMPSLREMKNIVGDSTYRAKIHARNQGLHKKTSAAYKFHRAQLNSHWDAVNHLEAAIKHASQHGRTEKSKKHYAIARKHLEKAAERDDKTNARYY